MYNAHNKKLKLTVNKNFVKQIEMRIKMEVDKKDRMLEIFFRLMKGEDISAQKLAAEYDISSRSISRDITSLKTFFDLNYDKLGKPELVYNNASKTYHLNMDSFITNAELLSLAKLLVGCRAFSKEELHTFIDKLKSHTTPQNRSKLNNLLYKELNHYTEVHHDCESLIELIWNLTEHIEQRRYITITYLKMNRQKVTHKIKPLSLMFSEYYYYLIAYECDVPDQYEPHFFRVDRIIHIVAHREHFSLRQSQEIDDGIVRKTNHLMFPGKTQKIRFAFSGPSVQAVLDKIPSSKVIAVENGENIVEADIYGDGIRMFLLSQGSWVRALEPEEFVQDMKAEVKQMYEGYFVTNNLQD